MQFEALLKWLNKNGVRERRLLKKLQKAKPEVLEKIASGPLDLFQQRRSIIATRSDSCTVSSFLSLLSWVLFEASPDLCHVATVTPLDDARKQLLDLRSSIPSHGLGVRTILSILSGC